MEIIDINSVTFLSSAFLWISFGLVAALLAQLIDPQAVRGGIIGTILTGVVGAIVGGYVANIIFGTGLTGFNLQSLFIAAAVAFLLVFLYRLFFRNQGHIKTHITRLK